MTVSCPTYGQVWGSPAFSEALRTLKTLGVEWVAIHPYAGVRKDGSVRFTPAAETGYLERAVERARKAGVPLFWKPHLAYWGSFDWRGSIDFTEDAAKQRFARSYRAFILDQARFAARAGAPLFAIGVELERLVRYEDYWRELIAEVRRVYPGRITYASNWDGASRIRFWDALDYVGVQAYYPLRITPGLTPDEPALRKAWAPILAEVRTLAERTKRPVLFTEIGYPEARHAAERPWDPKGFFDTADRALRVALVKYALREVERVPFVAGMFWWKWIPGRRRGDFAMQPPEIQSALRKLWAPSR